ncbi:MAG: sugar transporter, partial [Adhaeribacter sp.]|nr:sugar transporter [Adhaeribacter sp.]
ILFVSCKPSQNLVYFSDITEAEYLTQIRNKIRPKIQTDDMLSITVSTLSPESNTLFNGGALGTTNSPVPASQDNDNGYLVDDNGAINFPVIGQIKLEGLTKEEAVEKLTTEIAKHVKKPIINIRFLNFKISVIGEVNKPSTYTIPTEKINLLQAIALAGDLTPYGKRDNIALIREKEGTRNVVKLNLNNKELLDSPYFYLQQNDIIYVEPDKARAAQTNISRSNLQFGISVGLSLISVLVILMTNI